MAVAAEYLPTVYQAVHNHAHIDSVEHWYDDPVPVGEAESATETNLLEAGETDFSTKVYPEASAKLPSLTLVDIILKYAKTKGGVSRKFLKGLAEQNGFNTGSVSPTLVKLAASKRIFRIGKGVYSTQKPVKGKK